MSAIRIDLDAIINLVAEQPGITTTEVRIAFNWPSDGFAREAMSVASASTDKLSAVVSPLGYYWSAVVHEWGA